METVSLEAILKKLKEKDERDNAHAKRIKECETAVRAEEESIKQLQIMKAKLTEDLKKKDWENSKLEINHEIVQHTKLIWTEMYETTSKELKEEEEKLDAVQQSIFLNRVAFCDKTREYVENTKLFGMSCGFVENKFPLPVIAATTIKTEEDDDEYIDLLESIKIHENKLEELKLQEAQIEEAEKLKVQLQDNPHSGEGHLRMKQLLNDEMDEFENMQLEIKTVKDDITRKELLIQMRNPSNSQNPNDQGKTQHSQEQPTIEATTSQSTETTAPGLKVVKFNDDVEMRCIPSSSKNNNILKARSFAARTLSPSLRRKLHQHIVSKLDGEMKDIISQKND